MTLSEVLGRLQPTGLSDARRRAPNAWTGDTVPEGTGARAGGPSGR